MSGIYIHIPFCKQACHYCDFHFSTQMGKKEVMIKALARELELRANKLKNEIVSTIYFGGGTPSVLEVAEIQALLHTIHKNFKVVELPEITLEANPDDLNDDKLSELSKAGINRMSIGIQSFFDEDLQLMNRAHTAIEAENSLRSASALFDNLSIDLIYGIPNMSNERWLQNIKKALSFNIPHISSYALTVEPKTALKKFIEKGLVPNVDDEQAQVQFHLLVELMETEGFVNYETSNFGKRGYFSKNNTAYWQGQKYLGIGPSAHSFDGKKRGWNIRNNIKYIQAIAKDQLPMETEILTKTDCYNEYVMTGLRTIWGVSLKKVKNDFGSNYETYLQQQVQRHLESHLLFFDGDVLKTTKKGKFLVDGIAADLFMLNLK
ncbi:MAG: radical SAM family heme chaperone HemW [Croceitalea sp.]|nr:radical SAM family heme chaperone HemW [Croceitalea sp.]